MRKIFTLLFLSAQLIAFLSDAQMKSQADTIRPGNGRLMTSVLQPGLRQYLVYFQDPKKSTTLRFWYWLRDIKTGMHAGKKTFMITQHWYGGDSNAYREVASQNYMDDFAPVFHSETVRGQLSAFNWNSGDIKGADTVEGNTKKTFYLKFDAPNMNWNLDIETFEMLPLAAGKSFIINFYDAGLSPPKYILYTVTGSEDLPQMSGERTDCWILMTEGVDPKGTSYTQTFWISKKGHEFLKEEDSFNGMYRYKIKMPGAAPDLVKRFS